MTRLWPILFLSFRLFALTPVEAFQKYVADMPVGCESEIKSLSEFKLLLVLPEFHALVEKEKPIPELHQVLLTWSTDLLLKIVFELEQDIAAPCVKTKKSQLVLRALKQAYLAKMGAQDYGKNKTPSELLFRALIVGREDQPKLKDKITLIKKRRVSDSKLLAELYGQVHDLEGVAVLSPKDFKIDSLKKEVTKLCGTLKDCRFFDGRVLSKVIVTSETGLGAFIPELSTLILSRGLLENPNLLQNIVLLHELTHVAEKSAHANWSQDFSKFSGWKKNERGELSAKVKKSDKTRSDLLTELSKESSFSILPDAVYLGVGNDGFVMGKSFEESIKREDFAEDLADHVAIFKLYPERFCFEGKNIAPQKFKWIAENIFKSDKTPSLSCDKK